MKTAIKIFGVVLALAAAGTAAFVLHRSPAQAANKAEVAPSAAAVTVTPAMRSEVVDAVTVTGTLVPRLEVMVGPQIEGLRIVELLADEGDRVQKGQVLARLSRKTLDAQVAQSDAGLVRSDAAIAQAQSQIAQAQANATFAATDLRRAQTLLAKGAATQATLDQKMSAARSSAAQLQSARDALAVARADKKNLQAQRTELMVRVARTEVRTPEGGIVSRRNAKLGAVATAVGDPMFKIIAGGEIELDAEVPEQRLLQLEAGQPAEVELIDGTKVAGKVRLLSPEVDRTTRLGRVRISLAANDKARTGSFARARIILRRTRSITIPSSAVMYDDGQVRVQTVASGVVKTKSVSLGLVTGGRAEILGGLHEGEMVIVRAGPFLRDGDAVAGVPAKEAL